MREQFQLWKMTRPQVEIALEKGWDTAVATFGATEQHGLHLPLGTDWLWGEELGARITQGLGDALQVPAVRIGCSDHHMDFAGSLTYSAETFFFIVNDICQSLARHGFKNIALIPTHGGNFGPIGAAAERIRPTLPDVNIIAGSDLYTFMDILFGVANQFGISPSHTGAHAGENETSMILALYPDLVDSERAEAGYVGDHLKLAERIFSDGFKGVTPNGVLGDPAGAKAEHGEAYLNALTDALVDFIKAARSSSAS